MADKRVNVRLSATGGRQVKAELRGVGESGARGFQRLSREMELANRRIAAFARRARIVGAAIAAAATASGAALIRSGLQTIDSQAKLAQSLDTTVKSVQVLERAAELSGNSMGELEAGSARLTRRLSLFAADGGGPAAKAIERLGLNAQELLALPLDQRIAEVTDAIRENAEAAEQAALFSQLFGDRGFVAFQRLDTATLRQAAEDLERFGVVVSDQDADQIEATNDAVSRLGLLWRGLSNQLAVAAAPALQAAADGIARISAVGGPVQQVFRAITSGLVTLIENMDRVASIAAGAAAFFAGRFVAGLALAAVSVRGLATTLVVLRGALIRTGIGAIIVGLGELIFQFSRVVNATGSFGDALRLLGDVASGVWEGIKTSASSIAPALSAVWQAIKADFFALMADLAEAWGRFVRDTFENSFLTRSVESFNPITGARETVQSPFADFFDGSGATDLAARLRVRSGQARAGAMATRGEADARLTQGFEAARAAVDELRAVIAAADTEGAGALGSAVEAGNRLEDALRSAEDAATGAGEAGAGAGRATAKAAREAAGATRESRDALRQAGQLGRQVAGAFRGFFTSIARSAADLEEALGRLASRLADILANQAFNAIFGTGGGGGLLAGLFGALSGPGQTFAPAGGGLTSSSPALLPSFAGGGFTGARPRTGGLDGRGGFAALLHPNEVVTDLTRPRPRGDDPAQVVVRLEPSGEFDARVERVSERAAVRVVGDYDRRVLPQSVGRVQRDPRRRG